MTEELINAVLSLPQAERADLAYRLIRSLEPADDFDANDEEAWLEAWGPEIIARCEAYDRGEVQARDAFEVIEEIKRSLAVRRKASV